MGNTLIGGQVIAENREHALVTGLCNAAAMNGLLAPDEPPAVEIINADGTGRAVLVCDHASNRLPRRLGTLGVGTADLVH